MNIKKIFKKIKQTKKVFFFTILALGIGIISFWYFSKPASAAWFNDAWTFRKAINITNGSGGALTSFQVSFTIDTTDTTRFQSTCADIRVTDVTGQLIPYWIEENNPGCNNASTKIWTKVPSIPTSGATIYVYYGNPSAAAYQSGTNVFTFFDDFDASTIDTSKWTTTGTVTQSSGNVSIGSASKLRSVSNFGYSNLEFRMQTTTGDGTNRLEAAGFRDSDDTNNAILYTNDATTTNMYSGTKVSTWSSNGASTVTDRTTMKAYRVNRYSASGVKFYQSGTQMVDDTTNIPTGNLGLEWNNANTVTTTLDWVFVRSTASTDPTTALATEEKSEGPVGYWKFDEGNGLKASSSVWKKSGTTTNLVTNPSFETNVSGYNTWTDGSGTISSAQASGGAFGAYANNLSIANGTNDNSVQWWYTWTATSSKYYNCSMYVKASSAKSLWFQIIQDNSPWTIRTGATVNVTTEWQRISLTFQSPSTENVRCGFILGNRGTYNLYTDGVQIEEYSSSTAVAPYCDGSLLGNGVHSWSGTAHASTSTCDYGNDGDLYDPTWTTPDQCVSGDCLKFDGSNDYVISASTSTFAFATDFSVGFWIKTNQTASNKDVFGYCTGIAANQWCYYFRLNRVANKISFDVVQSGVADHWAEGTTTVNDGNWHYIMGARTTDNYAHLYVDGKEDATAASGASGAISTARMTLGSSDGTANFFQGFMDEVKIYPYARSIAQIKLDYNSGKAGQGTVKGTSVSAGSSSPSWMSNGLVGYWKMDEAASPSVDSSGVGNNGTWAGNAAAGAGKYGNGISLDGTGDWVSVGSLSTFNLAASNFSLCSWFKTAGTEEDIIANGVSSDGTYLLMSYQNKLRGHVWYSGNSNTIDSNTTVNDNNWHLGCQVVDSTNINLYIDGALDKSQALSGTKSGVNGTLVIGSRAAASASNNFNGIIDETRIYNRALSSKEVADLYNWSPGPKAYYDFEEGSGSTIYDKSGNNYSSTAFTGSPTWDNGKYGKAMYFNGASAITLPATMFANKPRQITLEIWLKGTGQPTNSSIFQAGPNQKVNVHAPWGSGLLYWDYGNACCTGRISKTMDAAYMNNNWTHFAFVADVDANYMKVYANGVLWHSGNVSEAMSTAPTVLYLGAYDTTQYYYKGWLDEFKIYDYVRTPKQIVSDMNASHPNVGSPVGSAIGYWKFDEGYGDTANNSGSLGSTLNGNLAGASTCPGNAACPLWSNSGKIGKALNFTETDATPNYLQVADDASLDGMAAMTISGWVYATGPFNGTYAGGIANKWYSSGSTENSYALVVDTSSGVLDFYIRGADNTETNIADPAVFPLNRWVHVAATYTGSGLYLYRDGVLVASNTSWSHGAVNISSSNRNLIIGNLGDLYTTWAWPGLIDEVKFYSYALTADEVKVDMNQGKSLVLGALSDNSTYQKNAANQEYCVPGDTTSCAAPVGEWKMDEGTGASAFDTSGNGNTGTLSAGAGWTNGRIGKAVQYVSGGPSVDMGAAKFDSLTNATLELWFNYMGSFGDNYSIFSRSKDGSNRQPIFVSYSGGYGNKVVFENIVASSNRAITSNNTISANTWYHLAITCGTGGMKMYLNGVQQSSTNATTDCFSAIAATTATSFGLTLMQIDQARIFDYARSAAQIAWDYNRGGPVGWWKFDECQGTTVYDASGNGNTGTITIGTGAGTGHQDSAGTCTDGTAATAWNNGKNGKFGSSLNYDGIDDYSRLTVSVDNTSNEMTSCAWYYASGAPNEKDGIVNGSGYRSHIWLNTTGSINYGAWTTSTNEESTSASTFPLNQWNHVCNVLKSASYSKLYVNGKYIEQNTLVGNLQAITYFEIGRHPNYNGSWFKGQIDDVRIFNYALTATQIKNVYNEGFGVRFGPVTGSP